MTLAEGYGQRHRYADLHYASPEVVTSLSTRANLRMLLLFLDFDALWWIVFDQNFRYL